MTPPARGSRGPIDLDDLALAVTLELFRREIARALVAARREEARIHRLLDALERARGAHAAAVGRAEALASAIAAADGRADEEAA